MRARRQRRPHRRDGRPVGSRLLQIDEAGADDEGRGDLAAFLAREWHDPEQRARNLETFHRLLLEDPSLEALRFEPAAACVDVESLVTPDWTRRVLDTLATACRTADEQDRAALLVAMYDIESTSVAGFPPTSSAALRAVLACSVLS
jgi:hypothetical protein